LPISREEAWAFFSDSRNLKESTPAGLGFEMVSGGDGRVHKGQIIAYRVRVPAGIMVGWVTETVPAGKICLRSRGGRSYFRG